MKYKVFIDGGEGTTGLKIHSRFEHREDIEVIRIDEDKRKDLDARLHMINQADVSFLCLPDAASREIAAVAPKASIILDTSTAHRTADDWVYGLPEYSPEQRELIRNSTRVAVPGCHATGAITLIAPLIRTGLVGGDYPFSAFSLTGYSGGGKKMIAQYEADTEALMSPRQYGITQLHKHIPEIQKMTGATHQVSFMPVVSSYYSGMQVTVPVAGAFVHASEGNKLDSVKTMFKNYYESQTMIKVVDTIDDGGFIASDRLSGTNYLEIAVYGTEDNILLVATFDNLGKGASGAAVQNMNILLGIDEGKGLI